MTITPKEKALKLCQKFGWMGIKWEQTNFTTLSIDNAKQCALFAAECELNAKTEVYNQLREFLPNAASEGVLSAQKEFEDVKQEIINL